MWWFLLLFLLIIQKSTLLFLEECKVNRMFTSKCWREICYPWSQSHLKITLFSLKTRSPGTIITDISVYFMISWSGFHKSVELILKILRYEQNWWAFFNLSHTHVSEVKEFLQGCGKIWAKSWWRSHTLWLGEKIKVYEFWILNICTWFSINITTNQ